MPYEVRIDDQWYSEDDLTVQEIEAVEATTAIPWSIINPFRSVKEYQALVGAFLLRAGKSDEEAIAWFRGRTKRQIREDLRLNEDEDDRPGTYVGGLPDPKVDEPTTSSSGEPSDTDGPPTS